MPGMFAPPRSEMLKAQIVRKLFEFARKHESFHREEARAVDVLLEGQVGYLRYVLNSDQVYGSMYDNHSNNATKQQVNQLLDNLSGSFDILSITCTNKIKHLELVVNEDRSIHVYATIGPKDEISLDELAKRDDIDAKFILSLIKPLQELFAALDNKSEADFGCVRQTP